MNAEDSSPTHTYASQPDAQTMSDSSFHRPHKGSLRTRTLVLGLIPVLILGIALSAPSIPLFNWTLGVPYAVQGKGPTFNTLGTVQKDSTEQQQEVVEIIGGREFPTSGHLNMTTVAVRHNLTLGSVFSLWLADGDTVVPIERVIPPNVSEQEVQQENAAAFRESESNATMASLGYLNKPVQVMVTDIDQDAPAAQKLKQGDAITAVDGKPITSPADFVEIIEDSMKATSGSGRSQIRIDFTRDGHDQTASLDLDSKDSDSELSTDVGFSLIAQPADDTRIVYNLNDVGGPSAGLMFSLAVIDKLSDQDLTHGKFIAGTGSVTGDGEVGAIGGITHKLKAAADAGATVFLVPASNCAEALSGAPEGLDLIKVTTVTNAVESLNDYNSGKSAPSCSASGL